jgi:hypothetical protein
MTVGRLVVASSALLCACSAASSDAPAAPPADASAADPPAVVHQAPGPAAGLTRGTDESPACTNLALTSADVPVTEIASDPPPPLGGEIALGTYDLVEDDVYTGNGGTTNTLPQAFAQTLRFSAETIEAATREDGASTLAVGRWAVQGRTMISMEDCPESGHFGAQHFSATPSRLYVQDGSELLVYAKR